MWLGGHSKGAEVWGTNGCPPHVPQIPRRPQGCLGPGLDWARLRLWRHLALGAPRSCQDWSHFVGHALGHGGALEGSPWWGPLSLHEAPLCPPEYMALSEHSQ